MDEPATPEEAAELALDEAGQADPVGAGGGCGEEGLQMLLDHPVQDRVGSGARSVGSHGAGPSDFCAVLPATPQDVATAYPGGPTRLSATAVVTERCADTSPERIDPDPLRTQPRASRREPVLGHGVVLGAGCEGSAGKWAWERNGARTRSRKSCCTSRMSASKLLSAWR